MEEKTIEELEMMEENLDYIDQPTSECLTCEVVYNLRAKPNPIKCPMCNKILLVHKRTNDEEEKDKL